MVDNACQKNKGGLIDRVKARESMALNAPYVYADLGDPNEAVTSSELNLGWAQGRQAANLEPEGQHWGQFATKLPYGERGSTAHIALHPDEEPYQKEKTTDGFARLSQAPPKTVTSCDKAAYDQVACAQCGKDPRLWPIFGRQTITQVWQEKHQKYLADDRNGDPETRHERAVQAADAARATFIHEFFLGGERRKQALIDTHYCANRDCRMAAGAISIEEQAMYIQTGEDPRFDHNVRHGWKVDLINDARHLRMAYCDPAVQRNEKKCKHYEVHMESLVRYVRENSFWMRNQEKQYVATASLLVIHCDAFGLCFGTEQEQKTFAQQMGQAPKEMFDKLVTAHVLSRSWHGYTLDDLSENQRIRGTAGSGCKTWDSTLEHGILGNGWPTPQTTAMIHRIVSNYLSMQCPFDGETPLHQVRAHYELRYWSGNEDQNALIKGPFDAVNIVVGKLNNRRSYGSVYKALMTANKGMPSYHVHEMARVLGEPGRQDDPLVRRSTKESVAYAACDNTGSGVTRQHLDMPAQLRASVIGLRMEENIGTVLGKHLPARVHAAGQKEGLTAGTHFLRHLLPKLVFTPLPRLADGHAFVQPTVVEAVDVMQGALNYARRTAAGRGSKAMAGIGKVRRAARAPFEASVPSKVLGGVAKSGFHILPTDKNGRSSPQLRQMLPQLVQDDLVEQDRAKREAPLLTLRQLLYVLRGDKHPRDATMWLCGPRLMVLRLFDTATLHADDVKTLEAAAAALPFLSVVPEERPLAREERAAKTKEMLMGTIEALDQAHKFFNNLLNRFGPKKGSYFCLIHTMSMEDALKSIWQVEGRDAQLAMLGYHVKAMSKASGLRYKSLTESWTKTYTRPLVDALGVLEAALANHSIASRVRPHMLPACVRTEPCDPAECPELQAGAMAQWVANYKRDVANGTAACTLEEYLTRDMHTRPRIAEQRELQFFERFEALDLSSAPSYESWKGKGHQRIEDPDLPFTDARFPIEQARREQYVDRVASSAQRMLTMRTINVLKATNVRAKKEAYRTTYLKGGANIDEKLRPKLMAFLHYKPPMYGPHLEHWYLYKSETELWTGGAGRQHAQMRDAASNGRRNASKLGAEDGPAARMRINQVWAHKTPKARAAERGKLFDAHIGTCNQAMQDGEKRQEQAQAVSQAGLAKLKAAAEGGGDAEAALDALEASPAKKAKPQTPHEWHRDLKKRAEAQQQEAEAHGFKQMHEGLREIGPDGTVGEHTSMMGAFREHTKDMTEDEKMALLPLSMRPKGYKAPKAPKELTKRTRRGRGRVVVSDSDSSDDDAPAIAELQRAPVLDEEEEAAGDSSDEEEEGEEEEAPAEGDDDDAGPDNADEHSDDEGQYRGE